jgi:hypothetical protein
MTIHFHRALDELSPTLFDFCVECHKTFPPQPRPFCDDYCDAPTDALFTMIIAELSKEERS